MQAAAFTGIRIGMAAVKALAEDGGLPGCLARLALLAKSGRSLMRIADIYRGFYPRMKRPERRC